MTLPAPRSQSGVIPYRRHRGAVEVLLVTSRRGHWLIPKGMREPGMTSLESACNEAYEEAGVRGYAAQEPLGSYSYEKWGFRWTVEVFVLEVREVLDSWPEMGSRQRCWLPQAEAAATVRSPELVALVTGLAPAS